jgi:toxin ParE1/3/4
VRVFWSPLAVQRVHEDAEHIARDRPLAAEEWVEGVFAAVERLKEFPFSGREIAEVTGREIREIIWSRYGIIHRVEADRVIILTVRHQRQRLDELEIQATE